MAPPIANMNRKSIISALIVSSIFVCCALYLVWPFRTVRQLHARYQRVQRGMRFEQVEALMAHPGGRASEHWFPSWDDELLPPAEAQRIASALRYSVGTFYLPVSFEFTFDSERQLIGRHISD
ncbi:MAG: hypothetical protein QOE70_5154 [Chthoniobacter sp.]|nr:hypothetical protein [Chthoniobacter sp.]